MQFWSGVECRNRHPQGNSAVPEDWNCGRVQGSGGEAEGEEMR